MGYCASGSGYIVVTTWNEEIENIVRENWEYDIDEKKLCVELWSDGKYYDDIVSEALSFLTPYTIEGRIRYTGEDDSIWEYWYSQVEKKWEDGIPDIIWPSDEDAPVIVPDGESAEDYVKALLIKELAKQFEKYGIDSQINSNNISEKDVAAYAEIADGAVQNESCLQDFIAGNKNLSMKDIKDAVSCTILSWIRNMCE